MGEKIYISDYLRAGAKKLGSKSFLICPDRTVSWSEACDESDTVAAFISDKLGGQQQKIVGILLPDSWQFVVSYFGIASSGNVALPLDITFKKMELDFVIGSARPEFVIVSRETEHLVYGSKILIEDILASHAVWRFDGYKLPPEKQVATLFLSSGTTGRPKATPNTHTNQIWDVKAISTPMGWTGKDTLLITLHLAHRHGLVICLLSAVYHGNTVYLEERFNPKRVLETLESGKISLYSSVPAAYEKLVEFQPETRFDLSPVRLFASSSSSLPPYLHTAFKKRFHKTILDRYGTSETGSIAIKKGLSDKSFGEILDGVEIRVEKNGEVALRSPGVFPGYLNNLQATEENMTADGWWLTGDMAEMSSGKLILKGRSKEKISKSGYSIFPQDIEWALTQYDGVNEVKVTGLSHLKGLDDKIVAFFTGPAKVQALEAFSKLNLPRSWRPDVFVKLGSIPKTANGKAKIAKLKEMASEIL